MHAYEAGSFTASVVLPLLVLAWAARTRDRDLWRRALLLTGLLYWLAYLPPFQL